MRRILSLQIAMVLLLSSLGTLAPVVSAFAQNQSTCENGECINGILDRLQDLGSVYQEECLPSEGLKRDLASYHEENGLTEKCWKLITEINYLESELNKHQAKLEQRLGCESGNCNLPNQNESLNSQLTALTKVEQNLSCTIPKKKAIRARCPQDMNCVLAASALGAGGYVAELMLPQKLKPKGCHLGNDSCITQLATGFLKTAISFFEGAWGILKFAGKKAKEKMNQFWNWVRGAENHSSTSQLAMAKASKDAGVFDMLVKDFPGTMKKIWSAFIGSMKEWLKTDIFCQKWAGVPRFSKCLEPTETFDCIPCKTMVTGLCAVSGVVVAEVVPAFLTGGLITAAKYGASGAVKIARLFKVSEKSSKAIKSSRIGRTALATSTKVDEALRVSKGIRAAKASVEGALNAIRRYLLSPARKLMKKSFVGLSASFKKGKAYVATLPGGKYILFQAQALKLTANVIIYPIQNPMTVLAFKAGQRTFDKAFRLGTPKLVTQSAVTSLIMKSDDEIASLITRIEEAKIKPDQAKDLTRLEEELLTRVEPKRKVLLEEALENEGIEFNDLIRHVYPELQYGALAKKLPKEKILRAEKELLSAIESMSEGPVKTTLHQRYQSLVQSESRKRLGF